MSDETKTLHEAEGKVSGQLPEKNKKQETHDETSPLKFTCPHCEQHLSSEGDVEGIEVQCPQCSKSFKVSSRDGENGKRKEGKFSPTWKSRVIIGFGVFSIVALSYIMAKQRSESELREGSYSDVKIWPKRKSSDTNGYREKPPTRLSGDKYEYYMSGYRNPSNATMARELLRFKPSRRNQEGGKKDILIVEGADDKLAGRSPRYKRSW